jgi:LmbE family N-acetylglucosaminyl deacetylase
MAWIHSTPDERITLSVDVSPGWEAKLAAMRCHATQLGSSPLMNRPMEQQRLFFGMEHFVRVASRIGSRRTFMDELRAHQP